MFYTSIIKSLLLVTTIVMQPNGVGTINTNGESHTCGWDLNWFYTTGKNEINICQSAPDKKRTLIHELWHYAFENKLNRKQKDYWYNIRPNDSELSRDELFAEMFREKVQNDYNLCKWELKYCMKELDFMDKVFLLLKN